MFGTDQTWIWPLFLYLPWKICIWDARFAQAMLYSSIARRCWTRSHSECLFLRDSEPSAIIFTSEFRLWVGLRIKLVVVTCDSDCRGLVSRPQSRSLLLYYAAWRALHWNTWFQQKQRCCVSHFRRSGPPCPFAVCLRGEVYRGRARDTSRVLGDC